MIKGSYISVVRLLLLGMVLSLGLLSCSEKKSNRAVYVLVDTSGTYNQQFDKVTRVLRKMLGILQPGESLALGRIDSESFSEGDIVARMTFDLRPSMANSQKRAFLESVEEFSKDIKGSRYTDITGGVLQAIEYLNETGASEKYILVFSDLKEEIKKGQIRDFPINFEGIKMVAMNVTKLQSDNIDPREYSKRVDSWTQRVEQGGGQWKLINDLNRLDVILQ